MGPSSNPVGVNLVAVSMAYLAMLLLCLWVAERLNEQTQPTGRFQYSIEYGGWESSVCVQTVS